MTILISRRLFALSLAAAPAINSLAAQPAAERPITAEEFRQIDQVLRREGFTRWGDITFDNGRFAVTKAVHGDGEAYRLTLSGVDFSVMEKRRGD